MLTVTPRFAPNDLVDDSCRNVVQFREFALTDTTTRISCANCAYRVGREFGRSNNLAMSSALCKHVLHIRGVVTQEQMIRAHASRFVTRVQHISAIWNRTIVQRPREPVRRLWTASFWRPQLPITKRAAIASSPQPAAGTQITQHLGPESVSNGDSVLASVFAGARAEGTRSRWFISKRRAANRTRMLKLHRGSPSVVPTPGRTSGAGVLGTQFYYVRDMQNAQRRERLLRGR
jgi:hypothetical protein